MIRRLAPLAVLLLAGCQPGSGVKITTELITAITKNCESMGNVSVPGGASISWKCTPLASGGATVSLPVNVGVVAVPAR